MAKFGKTSSSIITLALGGVFFAFFEKELTWLMRYGNTFSHSKFSRCKHLTDNWSVLSAPREEETVSTISIFPDINEGFQGLFAVGKHLVLSTVCDL